jgi:hypothetical protein
MSHAVEEKYAKAYASEGGRNAAAFPWASIIELIKSLLGGCTTTIGARRWARRNPVQFKAMVASKLLETNVFLSATDRNAATEAAYKTFMSLSNAELRKLLNEDDFDEDE